MASVAGSLLRSLGWAAPTLRGALPMSPTTPAWTPLVTSVRHRYHSEKVEKGPLQRNYGYKEKLHVKGMLPHMVHGQRLPMPLFRPKNSWAEKRALFGQNDYIDILGTGDLHPTKVAYLVPPWLRGFKGNEYQMLLRKRKLFQHHMRRFRPTKMREMNTRIRWLYRYLNQKTRDYYWHKS